jgi:hypothetical protein
MHENRETCSASVNRTDRSAKAQSRTADADALQESDRGVVPVKLPNNEEPSSTEVVEGRQRPKENDEQSNTSPTQSREWVSQGLSGVRRTAQERKKERTIPNHMPTIAPRFRISPLG